jgi:hypothetical protein
MLIKINIIQLLISKKKIPVSHLINADLVPFLTNAELGTRLTNAG